MQIIDFKINYCPIYKINESTYSVNWDLRDIDNDQDGLFVNKGTWKSIEIPTNVSPASIVEKIKTLIDNETQYNIINNFMWHDYNVYLSTENQSNYKANYDLAINSNGANLPVTFKFSKDNKTVYYTMNTISEISDFYTDMINFINTQLEKGWKLKDSVTESQYTI